MARGEKAHAHFLPGNSNDFHVPPRNVKACCNFAAEHRRLRQERLAAFRKYTADVHGGGFSERGHLVEMEEASMDFVVR